MVAVYRRLQSGILKLSSKAVFSRAKVFREYGINGLQLAYRVRAKLKRGLIRLPLKTISKLRPPPSQINNVLKVSGGIINR